mgnify:CR=1 FL=1
MYKRQSSYSAYGLNPRWTSEIPLGESWNMISSPLADPVTWADCFVSDGWKVLPVAEAVSEGWVRSVIYGYAGSNGYYTVYPNPTSGQTQIEPFRGYWFKTLIPGLTLIFPSLGPY